VKSLVVLRHSLTRKRLARALGDELPVFEHVTVGDQPRHLETAVALGCAVDEQVAWPSGYIDGVVEHHDQ
jgi:hypothetical protein